MWIAHHTAVSHWLLIDKPCSRSLVFVDDVRGTCNLVGALRSGLGSDGAFGRRAGNLALPPKMAAFGENSAANCSNVILRRSCRIACPRDYIVLVPVTAISRMDMARCSQNCELNLRFRLQQGRNHVHGWHRGRRQIRASLCSPDDGADVAEVSDDCKEQEVAANTLEFAHEVALDVLAPPDLVWKLWTDIKSAPLWMRWIDRVDFLEDDDTTDSPEDLPSGLSRLSRWICSTIGFEVMWVARVEHVESNLPVRVLRWATVEGLPSRGEVTFKANNTNGTTVELSISHSLPAALGRVMQSSALRGLVQATLQTDLECFQKYAAEVVNQQLECGTPEKDGVIERKGSLTITTDCSQNL